MVDKLDDEDLKKSENEFEIEFDNENEQEMDKIDIPAYKFEDTFRSN